MIELTPSVRIDNRDFTKLRDFIYQECGINLSLAKKVLVESRLQKRLSALKLKSFTEYCNLVMGPGRPADELVQLIDAISTNKTDFFREPMHFQFMQQVVLPNFSNSGNRSLKVWSSACSSGEEAYTTAMIIEDFCLQQKIAYKITGTDISSKVLQEAVEAIYEERLIKDIPTAMRSRYLLRSKERKDQLVRIVPTLRSMVSFKRLNLMDAEYDVDRDFDVVFCRNVLIYFDKETQEKVIQKILRHLRVGGYLFIGHSESIYHMTLPVVQIRPTIFQKV